MKRTFDSVITVSFPKDTGKAGLLSYRNVHDYSYFYWCEACVKCARVGQKNSFKYALNVFSIIHYYNNASYVYHSMFKLNAVIIKLFFCKVLQHGGPGITVCFVIS